MSIYKTPVLLKKAVTVFKNKTDTLRTKVLVLASLRKTAMLRSISHRIHALVSLSSDREKQQARLEYGDDKAFALREAATLVGDHGHGHGGVDDDVVDLSEVAMFVEEDHGYPDWTHSLFDDESRYCNDNEGGEGHDDDDDDHDETSVLDIIRSNREVEGLEFNVDDEIDQACDMFIKRFRKRMNRSF